MYTYLKFYFNFQQSSLIKSANEEQLLTAAAQPQKIETDRSLNFVKKELEIDFASADEKHEFQADGGGIVESTVLIR